MQQFYDVSIQVTGITKYSILANTEQAAMQKANQLWPDDDFGPLEYTNTNGRVLPAIAKKPSGNQTMFIIPVEITGRVNYTFSPIAVNRAGIERELFDLAVEETKEQIDSGEFGNFDNAKFQPIPSSIKLNI